MNIDGDARRQAALPIRFGGLGLRSVQKLALPSYTSSLIKAECLVSKIIKQPKPNPSILLVAAQEAFKAQHPNVVPPEGDARLKQRAWDECVSKAEFSDLLDSANQIHRAQLTAAAFPHSAAWVHALPSPKLGLHMDGETIRISVAQRLGSKVCETHKCRCGQLVDTLGHHGLSCRQSAGRISRHVQLNEIIRRSFNTAGIPSILEPVGLDRSDGKRPDGLTLLPLSGGKSLCWDCTCSDTFAQSNLSQSALTPAHAANKGEERKRELYKNLEDRHRFEPIAVETTGVLGKTSSKFIIEIGKRIRQRTGDKREVAWLRQRLSMAIMRGNSASVLGTNKAIYSS